MTNDNDNPALAIEDIRGTIKDLDGWDACLVLIICLAECVAFGNSADDDFDEAMRLAQTMKALGDIVGEMMAGDHGGDDGGDEDPKPSPPSPDLLRKLLERRKAGAKP